MKRVRVPLGNRSYDILVGRGASKAAARALEVGSRAFILADARLGRHARVLAQALQARGWKTETFPVTANESFKDFARIYPYYGKMIASGGDRHSVLFALGGGVIGDAAGFLAGTYMRGISWVGVPTTLLAQVDSSIGGKTGVNHAKGKNLIGVFHQPSLVVCDLDFLKTLPPREIVSGLGEMIKYGLIYDPGFYRWLVRNWQAVLAGSGSSLEEAVARCARWKAKAVAQDERDVRGVREVLNFGHTVGHAIEGATRYKVFRHGEAIIIGMRAAMHLSVSRGHLSRAEGQRIDAFLSSLPVPRVPRGISAERLLGFIRQDKKAKAGKVRFVLLDRIGKTRLDRDCEDREILAACRHVLGNVSRR